MMEGIVVGMTLRDWLPLVAIFGPIAAALITLVATRYFRERKRLLLEVAGPEDLTAPMRRQEVEFTIKFQDHEIRHFNRSVVRAENTGNVPIGNLNFTIRTGGKHNMHVFNLRPYGEEAGGAVQADWIEDPKDDVLQLSLPFINQGETFAVALYFDGEPSTSAVFCRMEGVRVLTRVNSTATAFAAEANYALIESMFRMPIFGIFFRITDALSGGGITARRKKLKKMLNRE